MNDGRVVVRRTGRWGHATTTVWCALVLVAATLTPVSAQSPPATSEAAELTALRRSLDQIVVLLRQLVDQSSRRDAATLLMSRIEMTERRNAPVEQELRTVRERRLAANRERAGLQARFRSIDDMQKLDVTGSARDSFDAEREQVNATVAQKDAELAEMDRQIAALEADIATRRKHLAAMEEQLDRLMTPR